MHKDLTVTLLPYRSTASGMTTYSDYLIKALIKAGVNVKVVGFGSAPDYIIENGIPFFSVAEDPYKIDFLGGPAITYAWIRKKLRSLHLEGNDEVFHFIFPGANFVAPNSPSHTVVTAWGYYSKLDILRESSLDFSSFKYPVIVLGKLEHYYLDLRSYSKAGFVIGTTSETIEFWKRRIKSFNGKYIPLPVEINQNLNGLTDGSGDRVNFLIGERDLERPRNNVLRVLEAFKIIFDKGMTNFHLHLVGEYGHRLKTTVEYLRSIGMTISLSKYLPKDLYMDLLGKCDVSLIPRYIKDQGGYWPLEAMTYGMCVIASDLPAFRDFVLPGVNGFLVDPFSAIDIANKIKIILEDRGLLSSLRKGAFSHVLEVHNLETVGKQYANVYEETLNRA